MSLSVVVKTRCSSRMWGEIEDLVGKRGVAAFVREAISEKLRRPGSQGHEYREVVFEPRGESHSFDDMLSIVAARQPLLVDFMTQEGKLHPALRRVLKKKLTDTQARRIEKVLLGMKLQEIGHDEQCSKQAVSAAVLRAYQAMRADAEVMQVFIQVYGRDGEMSAEMLISAFNSQVERAIGAEESAHAAK